MHKLSGLILPDTKQLLATCVKENRVTINEMSAGDIIEEDLYPFHYGQVSEEKKEKNLKL